MTIMTIPIVKGKGTVDIDTAALPEAVYAEALLQGLKTLLNRGMSKVTEKDLGSKEEVVKEAMIIAEQNVAKVMKGEIKFSGKSKATKVSGAVNTEAMRIARERIKDALKAAGKRPSVVGAKAITEAAKELVANDANIIAMAEANLKARSETPTAVDLSALVAGITEDPKKVAKAEEKKAKDAASKPLSAKQAGQPKGRAKAKPAAHVAH